MEFRAVHTALFAGRPASRWATSTTLNSTASFARHISSTRRRLQEAEAVAPPPQSPSTSSGMSAYIRRRQQQQQQQQQQEARDGRPSSTEGNSYSRSIFSTPSSGEASSPSSSSSSSVSTLRETNPSTSWAQPSSVTRAERKTTETISTLGWASRASGANSLISSTAPTAGDIQPTREKLNHPMPEDIKLRLRPVLGRGVKVGDMIDFATGLKILNRKVTSNKVAMEASRQRFHERPGLKRKRLKSQRWRNNFKTGFRATCDRVSELAKQGW